MVTSFLFFGGHYETSKLPFCVQQKKKKENVIQVWNDIKENDNRMQTMHLALENIFKNNIDLAEVSRK